MKNTSDFILEKVAPIFNRQGYVGTSLSDLTTATQLTKGALYGNFLNKEDLAVRSFRLNVKKVVFPLTEALNKESNNVRKLYALTNYYRAYYELAMERGGCPILNIGVDSKHNNPALFKLSKETAKKLLGGLQQIIEEGIKNKEIKNSIDPVVYTKNIYAMIEGAVFMSMTLEDKSFLIHILDHIDQEIILKMKT